MFIVFIYGVVVCQEGDFGWEQVNYVISGVQWFEICCCLCEVVVFVVWFDVLDEVYFSQIYWGDFGVFYVGEGCLLGL